MAARRQANHESDDPVNAADGSRQNVDDIVERRPDDDHDLLTFGEAGARLSEEIAAQEETVARLRRGGGTDSAIIDAERRLASLRAALDRNRRPSLDELRASGFFRDSTR